MRAGHDVKSLPRPPSRAGKKGARMESVGMAEWLVLLLFCFGPVLAAAAVVAGLIFAGRRGGP